MPGSYLQYGDPAGTGYKHAGGEVFYTYTIRPRYSKTYGRREGYDHVWDIHGDIVADDRAALEAETAALEAAYAIDDQDIGFYHSDDTPSNDVLTTASTVNGIRVVGGVRWKSGSRVHRANGFTAYGSRMQHETVRSYQIRVVGQTLDSEQDLVAYRQSVRYDGLGGANPVVQESVSGSPEIQITMLSTGFGARQFGSAIGLTSNPSPPAALFANPVPRPSSVTYSDGLFQYLYQDLYFATSWDYRFVGINALGP